MEQLFLMLNNKLINIYIIKCENMILTEYRKKKLKEISIATLCIAIGAFIGLISLVFFYYFNLAIFGFNIGLILSPLIAGYVETYLAEKIYGKTTGAVSAFLLFIVTILYGFIYTNTGLGFNIITIGSAAVILQAAFPILINYFLVVVVLGIISYILGIFKTILQHLYFYLRVIYYKLFGKKYIDETGNMDYDEDLERLDINKLGILFLSTTSIPDKNIKKFKGIYEGKIFIKNQNSLINKESEHKGEILIKNLQKARQQALINIANDSKRDGCDAILDLTIEFDTIGGLAEDNIHIVARGTGVKLS